MRSDFIINGYSFVLAQHEGAEVSLKRVRLELLSYALLQLLRHTPNVLVLLLQHL